MGITAGLGADRREGGETGSRLDSSMSLNFVMSSLKAVAVVEWKGKR